MILDKFLGSSPRMRGSRELVNAHHVYLGIIPAHAGLTHGCTPSAHNGRDHPRACGAHLMSAVARKTTSGSSPRMRGSPTAVEHSHRI